MQSVTEADSMDVTEAIETRLELKTYSDEPVDDETKRAILEAGRLTPSGRNRQPWRFVVVEDQDALDALAEESPSGPWIANADFAVAICVDASHEDLRDHDHIVDAGRAVTHMQLVAWEHGVGSRIFTVSEQPVYETLAVPPAYDLPLIVGFGYPDREIQGLKDRKPLESVVDFGTFGGDFELDDENTTR